MDARNRRELVSYTHLLAGRKCSINRSKGLGENEPDMMWLTTMNPETRRLIKVMPEDVERTAAVFDLLLGDNLQGRKDHIAENEMCRRDSLIGGEHLGAVVFDKVHRIGPVSYTHLQMSYTCKRRIIL